MNDALTQSGMRAQDKNNQPCPCCGQKHAWDAAREAAWDKFWDEIRHLDNAEAMDKLRVVVADDRDLEPGE